ncbi:putative ABC transporter, permease component, Macrolide export permease protein [Nitrospira sp. KM1]|uniref:ABC transporter permease n=1 Tax=Nitrospira sp. KM1 TaxID=1936990 RepID=UPI0013A77F7C|nr:ABC transporter permease [Nitrospira sp. KM1]BCA56210.1 putative ABC transporter, permease component, Macrolide export permease protein [Nitrospira sp. KM1]
MPAFIWLTTVTALRILGRNRLRAGLTMLGIIIGVAAVIAMVGIGEGAKRAVQAQIASIGTNVVIVFPGATTVSGVRSGQGGAVTLTVADALDIKKRIPLLADTGWAKRDVMQIVNGNRNWNGPVSGISPNYLTIRDWSFTSGGAFTQADLDSAARVALIGQTVVENLFEPGEEPVGAVIRIRNVPFRVIGVLTPKGQSAQGSDQDDVIFIPFTTGERKVFGTSFLGSVGAIVGSTDRPEDLPEAVDQIREVLRMRHRLQYEQNDDFTVRTQVDIGKVQEGTSQTLTIMLFSIASVSLVVGGIGIMNILLVSVTERTREIGVRMAVGAKRRHILMQFLIEAMTLSLLGGIAGIAFGIVGAKLTTIVAGWPTIISGDVIGVAFLFSLAVGLFFGLYPARKASRLNPIDALRYE